jgi:hypothetical protein
MASTTFIDGQSVIYSSWLNDVNNAVYNGNFAATTIYPTSIVSTNATITNATITNATITNSTISNLTATFSTVQLTNNFAISQSGTKIYFKYNGTNIASLDSSGNLIALANVTAYGTP